MFGLSFADSVVVGVILFALVTMLPLAVFGEYTKPRITHLLSVEWYGYVQYTPVYGFTVEVRQRRLFRSESVTQRAIVASAYQFGPLRDVGTWIKLPYWLDKQLCRWVDERNVKVVPDHEAARRCTQASKNKHCIGAELDSRSHP